MHPTRSYLICATPRSGSTLLCEALTNTGIAGYPKEYFEDLKTTRLPRRPSEYFTTLHTPNALDFLKDFFQHDSASASTPMCVTPTYADYLARVFEEGTTPNGVFGAKVMWGYFADFISNLRTIPAYQQVSVPDLLSTVFPDLRYIRVVRLDKVGQAISLWKAIQTWTWREDAAIPSTNGSGHPKRELQFHFELIDHLVQQIVAHELAWQRFFDEAGIKLYSVIYEDLAANYEATALGILHYLGIPIPENIVFAERQMKQQADAHSKEWARHYHQLKGEFYLPK